MSFHRETWKIGRTVTMRNSNGTFAKGNRHLPKETIEKIVKSAIGRKHTKEVRRKMSKSAMGNQRGLGNQNALGYKHTEEAKLKMSIAKKEHWEKRRVK